MKDDIEEVKDHEYKNYMNIIRLTIMSEEMPLSERLIAGKIYTDQPYNGNGDVKHKYE